MYFAYWMSHRSLSLRGTIPSKWFIAAFGWSPDFIAESGTIASVSAEGQDMTFKLGDCVQQVGYVIPMVVEKIEGKSDLLFLA
jgi:hypothetical protein